MLTVTFKIWRFRPVFRRKRGWSNISSMVIMLCWGIRPNIACQMNSVKITRFKKFKKTGDPWRCWENHLMVLNKLSEISMVQSGETSSFQSIVSTKSKLPPRISHPPRPTNPVTYSTTSADPPPWMKPKSQASKIGPPKATTSLPFPRTLESSSANLRTRSRVLYLTCQRFWMDLFLFRRVNPRRKTESSGNSWRRFRSMDFILKDMLRLWSPLVICFRERGDNDRIKIMGFWGLLLKSRERGSNWE